MGKHCKSVQYIQPANLRLLVGILFERVAAYCWGYEEGKYYIYIYVYNKWLFNNIRFLHLSETMHVNI